jgi:hypothetical protein
MKARVWIPVLLLAVGVLGARPPLSWAADAAAPLDDHARALNRAAQTPEGERRVVEHLSQELKVPAAMLRAQREQSRLGWGELSIAYRVSQKTGVPLEQLIAEHKSGKGWGEIAKEHNVKLGPIVSEAKESSRALEAKTRKGHKGDEADEGERVHRGGKPDKEGERPSFGGGPGGGHGRGRGK